MEEFDAFVLPLLQDGCIRYQAGGAAKSMSPEYFRKSFRMVAATESPATGQRAFYYQSTEHPDWVMRLGICGEAGLSALLMLRSDFEKQAEAGGSLQ